MGAASSAGAAVVDWPPAPQPQADSQLLQPLLQQLFLQQLWQENRPSSKPRWQQLLWQQLLWQQLLRQQLSHELQPQAGSAAQLGAASQLGAAAQAGSAQPPQQDFLQQWPQPNNPLCSPANRPQQCCLWQQRSQPRSQPRSQQLGASQQAFSAQQLGSQPLSQPQAGSHDFWQQLLQPQSFRPNMRSKSSKPKLWLHRPTLTTSAPKTMFHFIEQRLLYLNCG